MKANGEYMDTICASKMKELNWEQRIDKTQSFYRLIKVWNENIVNDYK